LLEYGPYVVEEVKKNLKQELGWQYYGWKHYESIFTRFYQGYILPVKFGIDKRKAHLSSLVVSGQMTRQEALREMEKESYSKGTMEEDKRFFLKKLGLTDEEFQAIMKLPPKSHYDFLSAYPPRQ
jgi:hypothetical protein